MDACRWCVHDRRWIMGSGAAAAMPGTGLFDVEDDGLGEHSPGTVDIGQPRG